jgi:hypothetical protein
MGQQFVLIRIPRLATHNTAIALIRPVAYTQKIVVDVVRIAQSRNLQMLKSKWQELSMHKTRCTNAKRRRYDKIQNMKHREGR